MKAIIICKTLTQRVIRVMLISALFAFQVNSAFSQTQEPSLTSVNNPGTDAHEYNCVFPPEWNADFPVTTSPHLIFIEKGAALTINGIHTNTCDYVGCFYEDNNGNLKCGAADFLIQGEAIVFPVYGDDPDTPEKDGFSYGETIHFCLFSWPCAGGKTIDVESVTFDTINYPTTNKWYPLGFSSITSMTAFTDIDCQIAVSDPIKENINLTFKKGWNTFTYQGNEQDTENFLSLLAKRMIAIKEVKGVGIIWPEKGISTINNFIRGKGYMINVDEACEISF